MSFDKPTRNQLSRLVSAARDKLRIDITAQLQTNFRLQPDGTALSLDGLTDDQRTAAEELRQLLDHFAALIPASNDKKANVRAQAYDRLVREIGFTILNRLAALRLCEERGLVIECVRQGMASAGFQMFDKLANGALGPRYETYRAFLENLFDELAIDLGVLFDRHSPLSHVFPGERALEEVLDLLNDPALTHLWAADETIGWIYQYYNDEAERRQMRDESQAPRNSRELAVRNQFFTPRYVVEFLTDNTLGRIWYEMRGGDTALREKCRYLVIRPPSPTPSAASPSEGEGLGVRVKKDPRDIKMLDPAGGSGHFGLYCFDLFETIYAEAYDDPDLGPKLQADYPDRAEFLRQVPRLILEHNIHIIDIDPRACQIAALALWLRAQRSWQAMGLKAHERPRITRANVVCAEPMPGERDLLDEFAADLQPPELAELVRFVFGRMQLAGEAGSLLKIEEDLRAKIEELRAKAGPLFAQGDFWDNAEVRALNALRDYTEQASNGGSARRLLFADDTAQGFAFIDLCLKKYDVVLMNPPFGAGANSINELFDIHYPDIADNFGPAFSIRAFDMCSSQGVVGTVIDHAVLIRSSFGKYRKALVVENQQMKLVCHFGWETLDGANVEVSAYVAQSNGGSHSFYYFDCTAEPREDCLITAVESVAAGRMSGNQASLISANAVGTFPHYAISPSAKSAITQRTLSSTYGIAKQGLAPVDASRFIHLKWEADPRSFGPQKIWMPVNHGGEYSPFYRDQIFIINWKNDGYFIKQEVVLRYEYLNGNWGWVVKNSDWYRKPGLCYGKRTDLLSVQVLAKDMIFTNEGYAIFPHDESRPWLLLGILNSRSLGRLLNTFCGQHKEGGYVNKIPIPEISDTEAADIEKLAQDAFIAKRHESTFGENSPFFLAPPVIQTHDLEQVAEKWDTLRLHARTAVNQAQEFIDAIVAQQWNNDLPTESLNAQTVQLERDSRIDDVNLILSYAVGITFGRWDVRIALDPSLASKLPDPFDPLPVCPPGMLVGPDGLPATSGHIVSEEWFRARPNAITLPSSPLAGDVIPDAEYPIRIVWDGILVDDPGLDDKVEHLHADDIVQCVREVLGVLWSERAEVIEQEACEILGVKSLRDYFRAPSGFFADHLKRYSKSRRQAPIYWPLSTASGRYTVWVYYHRLTQDTLFGIVNGYVTPKIDEVQAQVDKLADKVKGASGKAAVDLRAQLDDLKSFLGELNDFKAELLRVAALPYKPDLNDGVIINAAPLHKLFRLRKWATDTAAVWKKLEAGEYDWAHLAYTVWPKRVEKVCETDRSIAIAHGLEHLCKVEVKKSKGKRKKKVAEEEEND